MSLGKNISFLRKQKKLTQEQFADRMSVTRQTVSRWEADEVVPELDRHHIAEHEALCIV